MIDVEARVFSKTFSKTRDFNSISECGTDELMRNEQYLTEWSRTEGSSRQLGRGTRRPVVEGDVVKAVVSNKLFG
jgi:hypothetical protein